VSYDYPIINFCNPVVHYFLFITEHNGDVSPERESIRLFRPPSNPHKKDGFLKPSVLQLRTALRTDLHPCPRHEGTRSDLLGGQLRQKLVCVKATWNSVHRMKTE
jgi:hypothetical protein